MEGNIFSDCSFGWAQMKILILKELFGVVQKLEKSAI